MNEFLNIIKKTSLFCGLSDLEIDSALSCLGAKVKSFNKGAVILSEGEKPNFIGIVLDGEVEIQKIDYAGYANIISKIYPGDYIAASACFSSEKGLPFDIICASHCEILCLMSERLIKTCPNACAFHTMLVKNMLNIIADRNIILAAKIDILTKRTTREKVLTYLYSQSKKTNSKRFSVPLSRRQMAEYLSVNRSALSKELCNLRDEGIIEFDKNSFVLIGLIL